MAYCDRAADMLGQIAVPQGAPQHLGRLVAFDGVMLEVTGLVLAIGSAVRIACADGQSSYGEVVGFSGARSLIITTGGIGALAAGAMVFPARYASDVEVGPGLLGRIIDACGLPIDGLGPMPSERRWPITGYRTNPLNRERVTAPFDVGVRGINALLTCGVGQRIAIIAGSGVGKSVLMGQIIAGSKADVVVVGLIGERSREVSDFVATRLPSAVLAKSVVVAVPADHAPLLRLRAAMRATAIAEYFRDQGRKVLLLIDSLTRVAHAQREIGLSLGEPATMKGYPPSALGLIPSLVERAGNDAKSGGAISAFYTVLADGDDLDDPIVDAARAICDGHIILSRSLAEQGVFPAIDVGRSISRVMHDVIEPAHHAAAANYRRLWSTYESNRDLILMGAYAAGSDPVIDEAIRQRQAMLDFLHQAPDQVVPVADAIAELTAEFGA